MIVTLPWPPKELNPNSRVHFRTKAAHTKSYRESAYWLAKAAQTRIVGEGPVQLWITFNAPDKRRRDADNMFAACKSAFDGIADALQVNDVRFRYVIERGEPVKGGQVVVSIT